MSKDLGPNCKTCRLILTKLPLGLLEYGVMLSFQVSFFCFLDMLWALWPFQDYFTHFGSSNLVSGQTRVPKLDHLTSHKAKNLVGFSCDLNGTTHCSEGSCDYDSVLVTTQPQGLIYTCTNTTLKMV